MRQAFIAGKAVAAGCEQSHREHGVFLRRCSVVKRKPAVSGYGNQGRAHASNLAQG